MSFYQSYCSALKKQTGYFACWLPNSHFSLGDFGTISENVFNRLGNISDLGISDTISSRDANPFTIQSEQVSISYNSAEGEITTVPYAISGEFSIRFNKENSFYLSIKDCSITKFDNIIALGKKILNKREFDDWEDDWLVITELLIAGEGMIYISTAKGSEVTVKNNYNAASAHSNTLQLGVDIIRKGEFGFSFNDKLNFTPLFKLSKVKTGLLSFKPPTFRPLAQITNLGDNSKNETFLFFDDITDEIS